MSFKITLGRGQLPSNAVASSVGDPTEDVEVVVKSSAFAGCGDGSQAAVVLRHLASRLEEISWPPA